MFKSFFWCMWLTRRGSSIDGDGIHVTSLWPSIYFSTFYLSLLTRCMLLYRKCTDLTSFFDT
jgi:hypothetical protein